MANNNYEKLFSEFPEVTTEQWEAVITKDLKGADYQKKLVWRTEEGFNVRPYYRAEDIKEIEFLGSQAGEFPYVRGIKQCNKWRVHQTISVSCVKEANTLALNAIKGGANSIGVNLSGALSADEVATLFAGINPTETEIVIEQCGEIANIDTVMAWAAQFPNEEVRMAFNFDPIITKFSIEGKPLCSDSCAGKCFSRIAEFNSKYADFKRVRFTGVDGAKFNESGSTIVQELAFSLAAGHEYIVKLMEAGMSAEKASKNIRFTLSVSSNYFMEIAKFRAARMLWANIMHAYEPKCGCAEKMYIHAVTSRWNVTAYDPYVNMLRGTTEAMSAAIAGVHSIEVVPFNAAYEAPTEFSSRIARNVQLLLKKEAHFDNVVDAAGGSYFIENLTKSIAEQAWILFKEIEDKGGYIDAFKAGVITEAVEKSAAAKNKNLATRRSILLGTNQYPNFTESADAAITEQCVTPAAAEGDAPRLKPYRGGMPFEQLRLQVNRSGKAPKAFMLTCGSLSMARARAQFSCNYFACAGIQVIDNTFFSSLEQGVNEAVASGADIVVVCSSDDDYATVAPEISKLLGDKAMLVVAGAPACKEELEAQGITRFISVRDNVLETLQNYVKELGI